MISAGSIRSSRAPKPSPAPSARVELDVQGVHCAGCVWLMEELARRQGGAGVTVNPALGKVRLAWRRGFDVRGARRRSSASATASAPTTSTPSAASSLSLRLGVCAALDHQRDALLVQLLLRAGAGGRRAVHALSRLVLVLSTLVVLVGGSVFFRGAGEGCAHGLLHLDLPIAVGIVLVYGASLVQARSGRGDHAYLDTLCVFVTLMLVGRWLQERLLERNRRFLLEDDSVEGLTVRRRQGERLVTVAAAPGGRRRRRSSSRPATSSSSTACSSSQRAAFPTDWITGEPDVRAADARTAVPAGAFNAGRSAFAIAAADPLRRLAAAAPARRARLGGRARSTRASGAAGAHLRADGAGARRRRACASGGRRDPHRAVDVTVALLVVTCPCAIGIAGPLAYELTLARLRRRGVFVRSGDLLDQLIRVRTGALRQDRHADPRPPRAVGERHGGAQPRAA